MHYTLALIVFLQLVSLGVSLYTYFHREVKVSLPDMVYEPKLKPGAQNLLMRLRCANGDTHEVHRHHVGDRPPRWHYADRTFLSLDIQDGDGAWLYDELGAG